MLCVGTGIDDAGACGSDDALAMSALGGGQVEGEGQMNLYEGMCFFLLEWGRSGGRVLAVWCCAVLFIVLCGVVRWCGVV